MSYNKSIFFRNKTKIQNVLADHLQKCYTLVPRYSHSNTNCENRMTIKQEEQKRREERKSDWNEKEREKKGNRNGVEK